MPFNYRIYPNRERRYRTDYIILVHIPNFEIENHPLSEDMMRSVNVYTWNKWQEYFIRWGNPQKLPVHYFTEYIKTDWAIMKGLEDTKPSYFLDELVNEAVIKSKYRNSIVVAISEDFDMRNVDRRMVQHLSSKILIPLIKQFKLDWSRIKYMDECLTDSFLEGKHKGGRWKYKPMKNFDMVIFRNILMTYDKYGK